MQLFYLILAFVNPRLIARVEIQLDRGQTPFNLIFYI